MTKTFLCPLTNVLFCANIPDVDYKESWHKGGTGYIDGVMPNDDVFANGPLVKFVDANERSAISIKYTVFCTKQSPEKNAVEYAVTAFQRYSEKPDFWVFGGHYADYRATEIGKINLIWLEGLIINKQMNFTTFDYKSSPISNIDCTINISDEQMQSNEDQSVYYDL